MLYSLRGVLCFCRPDDGFCRQHTRPPCPLFLSPFPIKVPLLGVAFPIVFHTFLFLHPRAADANLPGNAGHTAHLHQHRGLLSKNIKARGMLYACRERMLLFFLLLFALGVYVSALSDTPFREGPSGGAALFRLVIGDGSVFVCNTAA